MRRILVATDFSARSERAVRRAALVAKQHGAEIVLCHVVDDDQPERFRQLASDEARRSLAEMATSQVAGTESSQTVVFGDPFQGILDAGRSSGADLIAIGSHRRQALRDIFVGTTAERIIRRGSLPVLLVNRPPLSNYSRAVIALDFSATSVHALMTTKGLGLLERVPVTVLHAFDALLTTIGTASVSEEKIAEHGMARAQSARQDLRAFLSNLDLGGVDCSLHVEEGDPVQAMKRATENLCADLLVLGTRGKTGGLLRFVLGSVAEEAIREIHCDVLAVPPTDAGPG